MGHYSEFYQAEAEGRVLRFLPDSYKEMDWTDLSDTQIHFLKVRLAEGFV